MADNAAFQAYAPTAPLNVAYSATPSAATPIGVCTRIAVKADTDAFILFGSSAVATVTSSNGWPLTGGLGEVFDIPPGVTHFMVVRRTASGSLYYATVG